MESLAKARDCTRLACGILILIIIFRQSWLGRVHENLPLVLERNPESWCLLPNISTPVSRHDGLRHSSNFSSNSSIVKQVERLFAAIRVPTETWDDNGDVGVDPRWEIFAEFHLVLQKLFPLVHERAHLEKPNRYNLVFTVGGSSARLKPILLTAHQDVVPANSLSRWTHPPFQPYFDGQFVWGRGSSDCKNNLIGVLSALESLLEQGWNPSRTVIAAFGFDEETGGHRGASAIARFLESKWGRGGFALVLDEGGMGLTTMGKFVYARPGIAEKGYLEIKLTLEVDGGHSSQPPEHSGIGIMAELIVALERNPYKPVLTKENPLRGYLECQAKFSPYELEPWLYRALMHDTDGHEIGRRLSEERGPATRFSMQTSQAVDIIHGGLKVNALPEKVETIINYRIATHNSLESVKSETARILNPIAQKHGLVMRNFGLEKIEQPEGLFQTSTTINSLANLLLKNQSQLKKSYGVLSVNSSKDVPPSPITPTNIQNDVWRLFASTVRQVFENTTSLAGKIIIPVGDIMHGNTDTAHYWNLTKNIYRFSPARENTRFGIHTVDEHVDINAHIEGMRLYYDLILNFDNATLDLSA